MRTKMLPSVSVVLFLRRMFLVALIGVTAVIAFGAPARAHGTEGEFQFLSGTNAGTNSVAFRVRLTYLADGEPVLRKVVTVSGAGPGGATTPPVTMTYTGGDAGGVYEATVSFPSPGGWTMTFNSTVPTATLNQSQTVSGPPITTQPTTTQPPPPSSGPTTTPPTTRTTASTASTSSTSSTASTSSTTTSSTTVDESTTSTEPGTTLVAGTTSPPATRRPGSTLAPNTAGTVPLDAEPAAGSSLLLPILLGVLLALAAAGLAFVLFNRNRAASEPESPA